METISNCIKWSKQFGPGRNETKLCNQQETVGGQRMGSSTKNGLVQWFTKWAMFHLGFFRWCSESSTLDSTHLDAYLRISYDLHLYTNFVHISTVLIIAFIHVHCKCSILFFILLDPNNVIKACFFLHPALNPDV